MAIRARILAAIFILLCSLLAGTEALATVAESPKEMLAAGRIDELMTELNGKLASQPADADSLNLLCRAYFTLDDWNRAESPCKTAASLEPSNGRFHLWLGRVYGEKADRANFVSAAGLAGKVRGEFERAVELSPSDVDARLDLAEFYLEAPGVVGGGEERAREQARAIAALNPGREHWVYARIAEKKKDPSIAENEYRQYIALSKGEAEAWLNLALFFRHQKRYGDMEQAIIKLSQAPLNKPDVLFEAAGLLYRANRRLPLAVEMLHRYLADGPVEAAPAFKAHYLLGMLLEKQGDRAGAAEEYRATLALVRHYGVAQQALNRVAR